MKVLYALQRTGNGHTTRAQELLPIIKKYADVEILASGSQSQINLETHIDYSFSGISLFCNKNGSISYLKTIFKNNYISFLKHVFRFPIHKYDLIINDFEPITAWACRLRGGNIVSLSHQASLWFDETPKPDHNDSIANWVIKNYAPASQKIGFHFQSYHAQIFRPIIRHKIRALKPTVEAHYVVYLPAFSDQKLHQKLSTIDAEWKIFSKHSDKEYHLDNCTFYPIDEPMFLKQLASCKGVLCNAGFELPSEALFLKKKLFAIPIQFQLEQEYNAKALELMNVDTSKKIEPELIKNWIKSDKFISVDYPDEAEEIIVQILKTRNTPLNSKDKLS
jgi:uncharacterized protein (TIGR00661 family)